MSSRPEDRDSPATHFSAEELLRRRDAILDAVARCNESMSGNRTHGEFADDVLQRLGRATGVSRVYVFEFKRTGAGNLVASQRFEWAAPGVAPQIDNPDLQGVDFAEAGYLRWERLLMAGEPVVGDIASFPPSERPLLEAQEILSLLVQPIFAGSQLWGMMGFDSCSRLQSWDQVEVDVLRIASRSFGSAIQRQEQQNHALRMQRMEAMGRMAGGIAHDFNNLLTVLGGAFEGMAEEAAGKTASEGFAAYSEIAREALGQAQGLTRRLLQFSRQRQSTPIAVDISEVVDRTAPLLRQALGSKTRLEVACAGGTPRVMIDPMQVEQILLNLVVNAKDAMPDGGVVRVALDPVDGSEGDAAPHEGSTSTWVRLCVSDTGPGIPAEVLGRIFEPFFTTKSEKGGTGLGLSTVDAIVTGCGGRVVATNRKEGGAEFRVYLPAKAD